MSALHILVLVTYRLAYTASGVRLNIKDFDSRSKHTVHVTTDLAVTNFSIINYVHVLVQLPIIISLNLLGGFSINTTLELNTHCSRN